LSFNSLGEGGKSYAKKMYIISNFSAIFGPANILLLLDVKVTSNHLSKIPRKWSISSVLFIVFLFGKSVYSSFIFPGSILPLEFLFVGTVCIASRWGSYFYAGEQ